jgi:hypothetical protein
MLHKTALLLASACALALAACAPPESDVEAAAEAQLIESGSYGVGPIVLAEFPEGFQIHCVDGDTALLFAVQPSEAPGRTKGVHVARRIGGANLPDVTPPPDGWATPLSIVIESFSRLPIGGSEGTFLLLDAGVTPVQLGMLPARVYRYSYRFRPSQGLTTTLLETHFLPLNTQPLVPGNLPDGIFYPGELTILPDGRVAVPDAIWGAVWVSDANLENWTPSLFDPRFMAAPGGPVMGIGYDASGMLSPYTYLPPAPPGFPPGLGLYPGMHALTYAASTDEVCFPVAASPGGIYCIGRAALLDTSAPFFAKSGDFMAGTWGSVRVVVPPEPGVSDLTNGVTYDRYAPGSPWLYWQRAPADEIGGGCNALRRVHLETGVVQPLACDNEIFNWTNEIAALPPFITGSPFTSILSSVGQQQNNPEVNAAIMSPSYFAPSRMPITVTTNF